MVNKKLYELYKNEYEIRRLMRLEAIKQIKSHSNKPTNLFKKLREKLERTIKYKKRLFVRTESGFF